MKRYVLGLLLTSSMLMQAPLPDLRAQGARQRLQEKLKERAAAAGDTDTVRRVALSQEESVKASQEFLARMTAENRVKTHKGQQELPYELKDLAQNPAQAGALSEVLGQKPQVDRKTLVGLARTLKPCAEGN